MEFINSRLLANYAISCCTKEYWLNTFYYTLCILHPELLAKAVSGITCHDTTNIDAFMVNSAISSKSAAK